MASKKDSLSVKGQRLEHHVVDNVHKSRTSKHVKIQLVLTQSLLSSIEFLSGEIQKHPKIYSKQSIISNWNWTYMCVLMAQSTHERKVLLFQL